MTKSIAIIPARGGSKRIPRKNVKEFLGKPIIAYSIQAALKSGVFDKVMVSTDDKEIAETAIKYGAEVPFYRSPEMSTDMAMTAPVLVEVLSEYKKRGMIFDYTCCIYATAPFINSERLKEGMNNLIETGVDSVLPVVKFSYPPQRGLIKTTNGLMVMKLPENYNVRSQDLEPIYHDCGQFYLCKVGQFMNNHSLILPITKPYVLPEERVQDIDTISDWKIAEAKYKVLNDME